MWGVAERPWRLWFRKNKQARRRRFLALLFVLAILRYYFSLVTGRLDIFPEGSGMR